MEILDLRGAPSGGPSTPSGRARSARSTSSSESPIAANEATRCARASSQSPVTSARRPQAVAEPCEDQTPAARPGAGMRRGRRPPAGERIDDERLPAAVGPDEQLGEVGVARRSDDEVQPQTPLTVALGSMRDGRRNKPAQALLRRRGLADLVLDAVEPGSHRPLETGRDQLRPVGEVVGQHPRREAALAGDSPQATSPRTPSRMITLRACISTSSRRDAAASTASCPPT